MPSARLWSTATAACGLSPAFSSTFRTRAGDPRRFASLCLCVAERLEIAQSSWETEKAEVEALREQMASAFEAQGAELAAAQLRLVKAQSEISRLNDAATTARVEYTNLSQQMAVATAATLQAEARATEIKRRTNDLRAELDHAHLTAEATAAELRSTRDLYTKEIDALRINLEQVNRNNESKDISAREALVRAREEAANLRGKLEVFCPSSLRSKKESAPRQNRMEQHQSKRLPRSKTHR